MSYFLTPHILFLAQPLPYLLFEHEKPGPPPNSGIFDGPVPDRAMRGAKFNGFA